MPGKTSRAAPSVVSSHETRWETKGIKAGHYITHILQNSIPLQTDDVALSKRTTWGRKHDRLSHSDMAEQMTVPDRDTTLPPFPCHDITCHCRQGETDSASLICIQWNVGLGPPRN